MAFSTKQLFVAMLFAALSFLALRNADIPFAKPLVNLVGVATVIFFAYSAWVSVGETRAFRLGFLIWVVLFWWTIKWPFDIGANRAIGIASGMLHPQSPVEVWINNYYTIGHSLLSLLFGLLGGIVTVYFYRKRQRMLAANEHSK